MERARELAAGELLQEDWSNDWRVHTGEEAGEIEKGCLLVHKAF